MKIIQLTAERIKRLHAVEINPEGDLVIIGGKNGAGKTSCLDSIEIALAGGRSIPQKPVHDGELSARVVCDLGDIIVERTLKPDRKSALVVKTKEGVPQKSPQAILDRLVGDLSFDPLEFVRKDGREQVEMLRRLAGVDFAEFDRRRTSVYEERKLTNRNVKNLESQFELAPRFTGVPSEEVSVAELVAELEMAQAAHDVVDTKVETESTRVDAIEKLESSIIRLKADLEEKERKLKAAKDNLASLQTEIVEAQHVLPDVEEIRTRLREVEETNRKVRANTERKALKKRLEETQQRAKDLTIEIEKVDLEKREALAKANLPVEGLSFDEDGVLFNGLPFSQAGGAEQIRISMAMGMALNPKLRVLLIRDGSLLDDDSLKLVAELAGENDYQCWIERVGEGEEVSVVIEDGAVK